MRNLSIILELSYSNLPYLDCSYLTYWSTTLQDCLKTNLYGSYSILTYWSTTLQDCLMTNLYWSFSTNLLKSYSNPTYLLGLSEHQLVWILLKSYLHGRDCMTTNLFISYFNLTFLVRQSVQSPILVHILFWSYFCDGTTVCAPTCSVLIPILLIDQLLYRTVWGPTCWDLISILLIDQQLL